MSTLLTANLTGNEDNFDLDEQQDEIETKVQQVLSTLETMSPEIQNRFCSRLLIAIAERLTPSLSGKAISAAKLSTVATNQKGNKKGGNKATKADIKTHLESRLSVLQDPSDPLEAWQHFGGADELYKILREESEGRLLLMLRHRNMPVGKEPRGKTSDALAKNIVQRISQYKQ